NHVPVHAGFQEQEAPLGRVLDDRGGEIRGGLLRAAVVHELEREHRPEPADVADRLETRLPLGHAPADPLADVRGPRDETLLLDHVEHRQGGRLGHGVADERPAHGGVGRGVHDLGAAEYARERQAGGDRLRDRDQVRLHAVVLDREQLPRAAEARLHLVDDEHDPVLVAHPPDAGHEVAGADDEATLALHRLDHDRRHLLGGNEGEEGALERLQGGAGVGAAVVVRERDPVHLRRERAEPRLVRVRLRGEREREQRPAVEGALEGDHRGPLRGRARELDRVLDRLGARVEEGRLLRAGDRSQREQALGKRHVQLVRQHREVGVQESLRLLLDRLEHARVAVADGQAADAAHEVDEGVAVDVGDGRSGSTGDDNRRVHRQGVRHHPPLAREDLPRAGAGNLRPQVDRACRRHRASIAKPSAGLHSCIARMQGLAPSAPYNRAMVLSDRTIRALLAEGRIEIDPYDESLVQPSSVDVRVDRCFRVFRNSRYPFIDVRVEQEDLTELVEIEDDQPFILHPGEFVLGSTLERVRLPDDLVARLEGKSSLGRLGLLIHSTAGFVDPGWDGHVTLELSNVANLPITIYHGMKIGQLSFMQLTEPAERPYGSHTLGSKYQGQRGPTPSRYWQNFAAQRPGRESGAAGPPVTTGGTGS